MVTFVLYKQFTVELINGGASNNIQYSDSIVIGMKQEMRLYNRTEKQYGICQYTVFRFIKLGKNVVLLYCSFFSPFLRF